MDAWLKQHLLLLVPFFIVGWWFFVIYLLATASGWRLLARRFRLQGDFNGQKWRMQSGTLRWMISYNNCLTIGADTTGLFMAPMVLFRVVGHPPLFIPWTEITLTGTKQVIFFTLVELRLGGSEQLPFKIKGELAARLSAAAGTSWPSESARAMPAPPPPIA